MKIKFTLFILFQWTLILNAYCNNSVDGCPGDVTLASQAEIDTFPCTELTGTLTISGDDITDLYPLRFLTKVGGLIIRGNKNLSSVSGLSNLQIDPASAAPTVIIDNNPLLSGLVGLNFQNTVLGPIEITNNVLLTSASGFSNLNTILGHLYFSGNSAMTSLWGFQNVKNIESDATSLLLIENNASLQSIELYSLEAIRGSGAFMAIINNNSLSTLDGLASFTTIEGMNNGAGLLIANNSSLKNVTGLSSFSRLRGSPSSYIRFDNNASLENIDGLENLRIPPEDLALAPLITIIKNPLLTRFCGIFNLLESYGSTISNIAIDITENGIETDPQKILAEGPCSSCLSDVTLSSQSDVDAFGCTSIEGNLIISGNDITNLDALSPLKTVEGNLVLMDNSSLVNLNGLSSLSDLGGILSIQYNSSLPAITGFASLHSTTGIFIAGNNSLREIDDFNNLTATSEVLVAGNPQLTGIKGFSSLTEIKPGFNNAGSLTIVSNDVLIGLQGFPKLAHVENLVLDNNQQLNSLEGMMSLTSIAGGLTIYNNPLLSNINAFSGIDSIGTSLTIDNNDNLTDVNAFSSLKSVGSLTLVYNNSLTNVNGFSALREIRSLQGTPYTVVITGNPILKNLDGLSSLAMETSGSIVISDNPLLESINCFSTVKTIKSFLVINNNESLVSFNGFKNLISVLDSGFDPLVSIAGNASLTNLDGLSSLKNIQGHGATLDILSNKSLNNIDGLSSLTTFSGAGRYVGISISDNPALKNINGLSSLNQFTYGFVGAITISNNALLEDVDGLSKVAPGKGDFFLNVTQNPTLMRCSGLLSTLVSLGLENIPLLIESGNIKISENGSGCTVEDILAGAPPSITNFSLVDKRTGVKITNLFYDYIALDVAHPDFSHWILQANTFPTEVGSVEFRLDNKITHIENVFPYQFELTSLKTGTHTVKADVYSKSNKQGVQGIGRTATIEIINSAAIVSFDVVDTSGETLMNLKEGDEINIKDPAFKSINIRANVFPERVANVKFWLNRAHFRTESIFPYALNGDIDGKYFPWKPKPGNYTLLAIPYIKQGTKEVAGTPLEIHFRVIEKLVTSIVSFDVVDTSGKVLMNLREGDKINISDPKLKIFSIVANTSGHVGSVKFWLDNQLFRTENVMPYTLTGDQNGYFNPWTPVVGNHSVSAIPYGKADSQGDAGKKLEIHFAVVNENISGNEQNDNQAVSVYPIPAREELFVKINNGTGAKFLITVRNNQGNTVYTGSYNPEQVNAYSIKTSSLPTGIYFLQLQSSNGFRKVIRLVKE